MLLNKLHHLALNGSKFRTSRLATQMVAAMAALSISYGASAGALYNKADKTDPINLNIAGQVVAEGDVYMDNHTWFDATDSLVIKGSLLSVTDPTDTPCLQLNSGKKAEIHQDIRTHTIKVSQGATVAVGGEIDVDLLQLEGKLTDLTGKSELNNKVTVGSMYVTGSDLTFGNLVVKAGGTLEVIGGSLTAKQGEFGKEGAVLDRVSAHNGAKVSFTGDVYANNVTFSGETSELSVGGTLHLSGSNSTGAGIANVKNLVVEGSGWHQFDSQLVMNVEQDMVVEGGTLGILPTATLKVGNSLTLKNDAFMRLQSTDKELKLKKLVLAKESVTQDGFQTYGAPVSIDIVEVQGGGRIDAYGVNSPDLEQKITIGTLHVAEDSEFAFSNSRSDNADAQSKADISIGSVVLEKNASFENGVWKEPVDEKFRGGANVTIKNLSGEDAEITNHNTAMTIGEGNDAVVAFNGKITDVENSVALTLNERSSWTVASKSNVGELTLDGGMIDVSKTDGDLALATLNGEGGTIVLDASKTNTVDVAATDENTRVEVKASENADLVTGDQAAGMVDRLEGVDNKIGRVDEGMYNGAINVDADGNVTVERNRLLADTLELASTSTLSLNRILMNDVRKRLGDIRSTTDASGVWARYDGGKLSGNGTTNKFHTIQVGGDAMPFAGMPLRLGVTASYTTGDVDHTRGDADMDAYSFAAYGTWFADNGMFADLIARVAKAESDMTVDGVYKGSLDNMAYSLSGEFGWRLALNNMFYAEPQVEATYTYIDSDTMTLNGGNSSYHYEVEGIDSFIGRLGVLAGMTCPNDMGDVYLRASVVHEFMGDAEIKGANGATLENDGKDTWFEYGVGANFRVGQDAYVWVDLERTAGALVDEDIRGMIGVRVGF